MARRIRRNPFLIKDGLRIHNSLAGNNRVPANEQLYRPEDLLELFPGLTADTLMDLARAGEIPHIDFGGDIFFPDSEIGYIDIDHVVEAAKNLKSNPRSVKDLAFWGLVATGFAALMYGAWAWSGNRSTMLVEPPRRGT
jgi:hypothetical protein